MNIIKIFLVIFFVIGGSYIYFFGGRCEVCHNKGHIVHYYWEQIGIPGVIKCEMLTEMHGQPSEIKIIPKMSQAGTYYDICIEYESLSFHFDGEDRDDTSTWKCYAVTVKDKSIKFNNNIHVGVNKLWIDWMFRHQLKVTENPNEYWAFGYTEMIKFSYDEHNRVSSITFYR